jgi:hypothetical protein
MHREFYIQLALSAQVVMDEEEIGVADDDMIIPLLWLFVAHPFRCYYY